MFIVGFVSPLDGRISLINWRFIFKVATQTTNVPSANNGNSLKIMAWVELDGKNKGCQVTTELLLQSTTDCEVQHGGSLFIENSTQTDVQEFRDVSVGPVSRTSTFCGFESLQQNPKLLREMTGVSQEVFSLLLTLLPKERSQNEVSKGNRLLLFLMKMKTNLPYTILGGIFNVHAQTVSNIFINVLSTIYIRTQDWILWPTRQEIQATMPSCFKIEYPSCRGIIDCTEVKTERPPGVERQVKMWSQYKQSWTVKFLVCIAPSGLITFVSKAYGGRSSDAFITNHSGILGKFEDGDQIMADKGFPHIQIQNGVTLVMPPFGSGGRQFTEEQMNETFSVANVRIHVERAIGRMKVFDILTHRLSTDIIPMMDEISGGSRNFPRRCKFEKN